MFLFISKCLINLLFLIIYNQIRLKEEKIFFINSLKYFKKSEIFNFKIFQLKNFKFRTLVNNIRSRQNGKMF